MNFDRESDEFTSMNLCKAENLNSLPLVELHLHLDGSITVPIARRLSKIQGSALPAETDEELQELLMVPKDCESLNDFLKCFALPCSLMQTKESLSEAAYLVAEDMRRQGVFYAEVRWAPQLHTQKGLSQEEAVLAVLDGLGRSKLKCNTILCCMRGDGNDAENLETLRVAKKLLVSDGGVVAVDLAGAEALFPAAGYRELFAKAKELGLPFTFHAGEAAGPENIRFALEYGASRIGHGVAACKDEELMQILAETGTVLEMCPTSNRQTHAVSSMSEYPFLEYLKRGIKATLNTDNPAIEGTSLRGEFEYMQKLFGLTIEQEKTAIANAIDGAFASEETKAWLRSLID